jgi:peptidoglycan/LPS O-acetylase OafA/YrhL
MSHPSPPRLTPSASVAGRALQQSIWSPRIAGLDFLRAIAVLSVLLVHSDVVHVWWLPSSLGSAGVKLFFVLSGFLITRLLTDEIARTGGIHLLSFYKRRIGRLMPAFYLFLALSIATLWALHKPIPWMAIGSSVVYLTNYYQAFTGAQPVVVAHCWSLAVEEQFYMLWPLLLAWAVRRGWGLPHLLGGLILSVWVWRWWLLWGAGAPHEYLYRALDTRADDLLVGCLLAVLMRDPQASARVAAMLAWRPMPWLLLGLLGLSLSLHDNASLKYGLCFVIEPPILALLMLSCIHAAQAGDTPLARLFNQPLLVHIGKVSYGVYLYHGLLMYSVETKVSRLTGQPWVGLGVGIAAMVVLASLSFRWFETPMRERINRL